MLTEIINSTDSTLHWVIAYNVKRKQQYI